MVSWSQLTRTLVCTLFVGVLSQTCQPGTPYLKSEFDLEADGLDVMVWDMDVNDNQQMAICGEITEANRDKASAFLSLQNAVTCELEWRHQMSLYQRFYVVSFDPSGTTLVAFTFGRNTWDSRNSPSRNLGTLFRFNVDGSLIEEVRHA